MCRMSTILKVKVQTEQIYHCRHCRISHIRLRHTPPLPLCYSLYLKVSFNPHGHFFQIYPPFSTPRYSTLLKLYIPASLVELSNICHF